MPAEVAFDLVPIALVVTDLEMPDMSGIELHSRLRQLSPSLKVLLSTGSDILTATEAAQRGFCGLLRKPFSIPSLINILRQVGLLGSLKNRAGITVKRDFQKSCIESMSLTPA